MLTQAIRSARKRSAGQTPVPGSAVASACDGCADDLGPRGWASEAATLTTKRRRSSCGSVLSSRSAREAICSSDEGEGDGNEQEEAPRVVRDPAHLGRRFSLQRHLSDPAPLVLKQPAYPELDWWTRPMLDAASAAADFCGRKGLRKPLTLVSCCPGMFAVSWYASTLKECP